MKEKNVVIKKKCPYCFLHISNDETGFLLKTDGARFISPALNDVVTPKKDIPYVLFWNAMGIPEEQLDAERMIVNQELNAAGKTLAVKNYDPDN